MNQKNRYFITGTDTGVGKTFASVLLSRKLDVPYFKPIQTGFLFDSDENFARKNGCRVIPTQYNFMAPVSPNIAAKLEKTSINIDDIVIPDADVIVEGAGGILTPIRDDFTMLDFVEKINLPLIVIVKVRLGMINHALLTIGAIRARNLPICGIIFNGMEDENACKTIIDIAKVPILGYIPGNFALNSENIDNFKLNL